MRVGDWIKQWEYFIARETYATVDKWTVTLGLARVIRRLGDVLYNKYMDLVDDSEGIANT